MLRRLIGTMSTNLPKTMQAIQIQRQGSVSELQMREIPLPKLKEDEVLIKTDWAAINFIDIYQRSGNPYKISTPNVLGNEVSGRIVAKGAHVESDEFELNDRVAAYTNLTGYAQYAVGPAHRTVKVPDAISNKIAAAALLQGLTALTALREAYCAKAGDFLLIPAAAGGLGLLLTQIATHMGCHVIGTTSTEEKAQQARKAGAEHVVLYANRDLGQVAQEIKSLTPNGEGVHATIDGVGKDTFEMSLEVLRRKGTLVSIGNASGAVPPVAPLRLAQKNIKLVRPVLDVYTKAEMQDYTLQLWQLIEANKVDIALHREEGYSFTAEDVQQAHLDLAGRSTTGKLLIKVAD